MGASLDQCHQAHHDWQVEYWVVDHFHPDHKVCLSSPFISHLSHTRWSFELSYHLRQDELYSKILEEAFVHPGLLLNHFLTLRFLLERDADEVKLASGECCEQHSYATQMHLKTWNPSDMRGLLDLHSRTALAYMLKPWLVLCSLFTYQTTIKDGSIHTTEHHSRRCQTMGTNMI